MYKTTVIYNEAYLLEIFRRVRLASPWRWPILLLRYFAAAVMIGIAGFVIFRGNYWGALLPLAVAAFIFVAHYMDSWWLKRKLKKSPFLNEKISCVWSESGIHALSSISEVKLAWSAYTKAVIFRDGVLLFQGPGMYSWTSESMFESLDQFRGFTELVVRKIEKSSAVN